MGPVPHVWCDPFSFPLQEEKKKFERASERYYQALDRYLGMSQKKAMSTPEDKVRKWALLSLLLHCLLQLSLA